MSPAYGGCAPMLLDSPETCASRGVRFRRLFDPSATLRSDEAQPMEERAAGKCPDCGAPVWIYLSQTQRMQ